MEAAEGGRRRGGGGGSGGRTSCCWAASEPMQPTPLLLSAEEGGRVSLTSRFRLVRWKCPPLRPQVFARLLTQPRFGADAGEDRRGAL